jgi:hypothetical protein
MPSTIERSGEVYKIINSTQVLRVEDGAYIPDDPKNADYIAYKAWCAEENQPQPPDLPTLEELKRSKLLEINGAFETSARLLTAGYPDSEKDSWPDQKAEAMAWYANNAAPTPYLDLLAGYRGIEPLLYRQKTVAKVIAYTAAAAYLIGTRQKYADQIAAATSQGDLDAIVPNFSLPGA